MFYKVIKHLFNNLLVYISYQLYVFENETTDVIATYNNID